MNEQIRTDLAVEARKFVKRHGEDDLVVPQQRVVPAGVAAPWMRIGALIKPTSWVVDGIRQMILKDDAAMTSGEVMPFSALWSSRPLLPLVCGWPTPHWVNG